MEGVEQKCRQGVSAQRCWVDVLQVFVVLLMQNISAEAAGGVLYVPAATCAQALAS